MASATFFFDKRNIKDGKGSVKVLITHNRKQRMYSTNIQVKETTWAKLQKNISPNGLSNRVSDPTIIDLYKILYDDIELNGEIISGFLKRSNEIIQRMGFEFDFDVFKHKFKNYESSSVSQDPVIDVFGQYKIIIQNLEKEERFGNASSYSNSMVSINRFCNALSTDQRIEIGLPLKPEKVTQLAFEVITPDFLETYEKWMLKFGKVSRKKNGKGSPASVTTTGIYLRHLRAVFNEAIANEETNNYPFGKRKYTIPSGRSIKKAITKSDIRKIIDYEDFTDTYERRSRDFWVFSYLCNGMNFNDILRLKWENYDRVGKKITFVREKTKRTSKKDQKTIQVVINNIQEEIIKKWSSVNTTYMFPFIDESMDSARKRAVIKQFTKVTNDWMKKLSVKLKIDSNLGTYVARHSFSTILLQNEAPIALISKALGHTSLATTEAYLGSFEDEKIKSYMADLI